MHIIVLSALIGTWTAIGQDSTLEYLIVAGGGGGTEGGGGGGGVITGTMSTSLISATLNVVVGAGGSGGWKNLKGGNGGNSSFSSLIAIGGGAGGRTTSGSDRANSGGSGGGQANNDSGSYADGTAGQGFRGGRAGRDWQGGAGGGGGAGEIGSNGSNRYGGRGGNGLQSSISGTNTYYGGGGGGGTWVEDNGGAGGLGGGGRGRSGSLSALPGQNNTGGGGGGNSEEIGTNNNNPGGSGIVIIKYSGSPKASGGTVTESGGFTLHTFTSVGTVSFSPLDTDGDGSNDFIDAFPDDASEDTDTDEDGIGNNSDTDDDDDGVSDEFDLAPLDSSISGHSNIIITGSATSGGSWSDSAPWVFTPSSDNANLLYTELRDKLNSGSVTISSANVSGTQGGSVILDWGSSALSSKNTSISSRTFTINAAGSITQNSPINLYTDGNNIDGITMYPSIDLFYNSGEAIALNHYITTTPGVANRTNSGYGAADGGAVSFNASTTITLGGSSYITTTGAKQDYYSYTVNLYAGDGGDISLVAGTSITIGSGRTITANGGQTDGGNRSASSTESPYRRAGNGGNITLDAQTTVSIAGIISSQGGRHNYSSYSEFYGGYGGDLTVNAPGGFSLSSDINLYAGYGSYYSSNTTSNDSRGQYRYTTPGDFTLSTDYSAVTSGGVNDGQTSGNIYSGSLTKNGSGKFKLLNHTYGGWRGNSYYDTNKYIRSLTINSGGILFGDTTALDDYTDITMTSSSTVLDLGVVQRLLVPLMVRVV